MTKYVCYKGQHAFIPYFPVITRDAKQLMWQGRFGSGADYLLPFPDSRDWNKGGGLSFNLLTNHIDSLMWGWRYNADLICHELSAYCHVDSKRVVAKNGMQHPDPSDWEVMLRVPFGNDFSIVVQVDTVMKRYEFAFRTGEVVNYCYIPFTHSRRTGRIIGPWFGGNRTAPQRMELHMKRSHT